MIVEKQLSLKPQDLAVAVKLAANRDREFALVTLSAELGMAVSAVHGAVNRAEFARLLTRSGGTTRAIRAAVSEFLVHGAKYAFPATSGATSRGTPTSIGAPVLLTHFDGSKVLPPVWPDPAGDVWGPAIVPLHACVPFAAKNDRTFYDLMALLDAIRVGAARERELAAQRIEEILS